MTIIPLQEILDRLRLRILGHLPPDPGYSGRGVGFAYGDSRIEGKRSYGYGYYGYGRGYGMIYAEADGCGFMAPTPQWFRQRIDGHGGSGFAPGRWHDPMALDAEVLVFE